MKKILLSVTFLLTAIGISSAQVLPSFQFGIKGGMDFTSLSTSAASTFSASNQAGYLGGVWARVGALGINFQPEVYFNTKTINTTSPNGGETQLKTNDIDVPLLLGFKVGALGFGARVYAGPLVSFNLSNTQTVKTVATDIGELNYKNQNYAAVGGIGVDIKSISIDARYQLGLNSQNYEQPGIGATTPTKVNLFTVSLALRLFKL